MLARLVRLRDACMPAGLSPAEQVRARFFVSIHLTAVPFLLCSVVLYGFTHVWGQVVLCLLMASASTAALLWFKRTGALRGPTWLSLIAASLSFSLATLAQTPPDVTNVCFLSVVPLLAALSLTRREAIAWVFLVIGLGLAVLHAAKEGYVLPHPDPDPFTTSGLNYVLMVLVLWAFVGAYEDVNKTAFQQLREADRAKSTFLATISHEIRTPMNGVLGLTEAMLAEPMSPSQRENLLVVQRSGKLLVSLINDLLDVTKAEAGKLSIDAHDFDVARVLDDVKALFEPGANKKGLALRFVLGDDVVTAVRGDSMRLGQVLNNLVSNAVKFTESGEVLVRVTSPTLHTLTFEVRDSGPGIEPSLLARLFTPFEQGDGSTTRRFGGTGLGLALAQQLVTLMGGTITVDSMAGHGARFTFTLTFEPARRAPPASTPPSGPHAKDTGRLVLVVDDNPINLAVAAQLVEKAGFRAHKAASGVEALEAIAAHDFVLVLMDCHMPEMDGFTATERIRSMPPPVAQVPVVALTASTLPEDLEACRRSGMNEVLTKPVSLATLASVLDRLTQRAA
jgi:signal transduction histidine kinase/CheY-like chemotaxis protein